VEAGKRVITYCHIGQQASLVYLIAKRLGYEVAMYDGSFTEWSQKELPVETP
jgi:thiosulfate/3-mercaptopyruvate sulfurtransferase